MKKEMTLHEYGMFWLQNYKIGIRPNTVRNYTNYLKKIIPYDCPISEFDKFVYLNIIKDVPNYTKERVTMTLKQVIRAAAADGLIDPSMVEAAFANVKLPKHVPTSKRALTARETEIIYNIDFKNPMYKTYLWIIFGLGLRREEALALSPSDITNEGMVINKVITYAASNHATLEHTTKSPNSKRVVPIPQFLRDHLNEYVTLDRVKETNKLFYNKHDDDYITYGTFQFMWDTIIKKIDAEAGYKTGLTSHCFRHNYCSNLCYQVPTISLGTVAKLLGDTIDVVMNTYNHVIAEREDKLSAIENALKM